MRLLTLAAVVAAGLLAGCAAEVLSTSPRSVVIKAGTAQVAAAQELANKECEKHGRSARLNSRPAPYAPGWVFDCV